MTDILLLNLLLIAGYLSLATLLGIQICRWLGLRFQHTAGEWVAGLLVFEFFSFFICWLAGSIFNLGIVSAFSPLLLLAYVSATGWTSTDFGTNTNSKSDWACIAVLSCLLITISTFAAWDQIVAVVTSQGVIYQDAIYHAGISRSIRELGFPIADFQFSGTEIKYHVFTHFFVAKLSFLTNFPEHQIYICMIPPLTVVMYCAAACSFFVSDEGCVNGRFKFVTKIIVILLPLFLVTLGGGGAVSAYIFNEMFSYSFAWQLITFTLLLDYLSADDVLDDKKWELKQILNLCLLLVLCTLIKGSSLPLLLSGFATYFLIRAIANRKIEFSSCIAFGCLLISGVMTYWLFFKGSAAAEQNIALSLQSFDTTLWGIISSKLSFSPPDFLKLLVLLGSAVSFRFVIFRNSKDPAIWFYFGCFSVGMVCFLFLSNNPSYFLFPALFMGNLLVLKILHHHFRDFHWGLKIICAVLMLLSIYPIANGGRLSATKKLNTKAATYYPLTPDRAELYRWLNESSAPSDIMFTPSVYGASDFTADNFFPAALSGRQFLMGGYRFGGLVLHPEFPQRLELVDNFSLNNVSQSEALAENGVKFVLIETLGNKANIANELENIDSKKALYQTEFSNSAGAIFSVN